MAAIEAMRRRRRIGTSPGGSAATNPFVATLCEALSTAGAEMLDVDMPWRTLVDDVDALLLHWPEEIYFKCMNHAFAGMRVWRKLRGVARWKASGTRIIWIVHNRQPHPAERAQVAAYKGVHELIRVFRTTKREDLYLLIAGEPTIGGYLDPSLPYDGCGAQTPDDLARSVREAAGDHPHIRLRLGFPDRESLLDYMAAVDLVVLALGGHLHSSSLVHALSVVCTPAARHRISRRLPRKPQEVGLWHLSTVS